MDSTQINTQQTLKSLFQRTYAYMGFGLFTTGVVATLSALVFTAQIVQLFQLRFAVLIIIGLQVGLTFVVTRLAQSRNKVVALSGFLFFTAFEGVILSPLLLIVPMSILLSAFMTTVGLFGSLAVIGFVTKKDMSSWSTILMGATLALFVANIVNVFVGGGVLNVIISVVSVIVFSVWTAYDSQHLRQLFLSSSPDDYNSLAVNGAFNFYLDFINLFVNLVRLFSSRN